MIEKKGFTLSEIVIAMVVLGIIVTACVPIIMKMSPNKNAIMIKKAYYTTEQIVSDLINDPVYYPYGDLTDTTTTIKIPGTDDDLGEEHANNKFACLFASKPNLDTTQRTLQQICQYSGTGTDSEINLAYTHDGMTYNISGLKKDSNTPPFYIYIDVNGKEGPNAFAPSYNSGNNKCASYSDWEPTLAGSNFDNRKFDRIKIQIDADGSIKIPDTQTEFINIMKKPNSEFNKDNSD